MGRNEVEMDGAEMRVDEAKATDHVSLEERIDNHLAGLQRVDGQIAKLSKLREDHKEALIILLRELDSKLNGIAEKAGVEDYRGAEAKKFVKTSRLDPEMRR